MDKIKNVRAGIVIIADAKLKLVPGQCVPVETLTPQMQSAIDAGLLARIGGATKPDTKADTKTKPKGTRAAKVEAKEEPTATDDGQPESDGSDDTTSESPAAPGLSLTSTGEDSGN